MNTLRIAGSAVSVCALILVAASPASAAPNSPRNVTSVAEIGELTVYWDAPEGTKVTSYLVSCQAASGSGSASLVTSTVSSRTLSKEFSGLAAGVSYECRVAARDSAGESAPAAAAPALVVGVPQPPSIANIAPVAGGVNLTVTPPANTGGLAILDYRAVCGSVTVISTSTSISVSLPDEDRQVTCTVRARNAAGISDASGSVGAMAGQKPWDAKVTRVVSPQPGEIVATVSASNQKPYPISKYTLTCLGINGTVVTGASNVSPVTITGVAGGNYTCTVVAENSYGASLTSLPSSVVKVVPLLVAPAAPALTWSPTDRGADLVVSYDRVDGATRYRVECKRPSETKSASSTTTSAVISVVPGVWSCTLAYELQRFASPISAPGATTITPSAPKITAGKASISATRPPGLKRWALECTHTDGKRIVKRSSSTTISWTKMRAGTYSCIASGNAVKSSPVSAKVT